MIFNNRFYKNNFLHVYSHDVEDNVLKLTIINIKDINVQSIKVSFQENIYDVEVNSCEQVIDLNIVLATKSVFIETPIITSITFDGKEVECVYDDYMYLIQPKSISNMRCEKYLYIKKMVKYNGCKKENVHCHADQFKDYWHCTCGAINFNVQQKCIKCGNSKETLFSTPIDNSKEELETRKIVKSNFILLWWLFILMAIHLFIIDMVFKGDVLFESEVVLTLSAILNRLVAIGIPFASTIGLIFARRRYNYVLERVLDIIRFSSLLYINILLNVSFVHNSYLFVLFVSMNVILICFYGYQLLNKIQKIQQFIIIPLLIGSLVSGVVQANIYSKHDLKVGVDGVTIRCTYNDKVYEIPETINNKKVTKIHFTVGNDYSNIEEIYIPKYVENVTFPSMSAFPNLKKVVVDSENSYLYTNQDILFRSSDQQVLLVPTTVKSINIDWEVVNAKAFYECINIEEVVIGKNVSTIEDYAFAYCSKLNKVSFEEGSTLEYLGQYSFLNCSSIGKIKLPNSLKQIGCPVFYGCTNLEELTIPFLGEIRYEDRSYTNKNAFAYILGSSGDYRKSDPNISKLKVINVTNQKFLENAGFYYCIAEEININNIIGEIGMNSFYSCENLKRFTVSEGVDVLGENCFANCSSLEEITLPSTLTSIERNAFVNCDKLENINFHEDIDLEALLLNIDEGNDVIVNKINEILNEKE